MTVKLARHGQEEEVLGAQYISNQLLQIAADYNSLPDLRKITVDEISFFYEPLIPGLIEMQKEKMKNRS